MKVVVLTLRPTQSFADDIKSAPVDIQKAAKKALQTLTDNPGAKKLRLHPLQAHKPTIWKIDVLTNKSWQIAFNLVGTEAVLLRLATHKTIDRM